MNIPCSIKYFNIAPAQVCVPMSDYDFKMYYIRVIDVIELWIIFYIRV